MRKTLAGGGFGYAKKISFVGIKFDAVYNPIIIDQYYCPTKQNCLSSVSIPNYDLYLSSFYFTFSNPYYLFLIYFGWNDILNMKARAVKLSDITFSGISGTSNMENVINLSCSKTVACTNIVVNSVYIKSAIPGRKVYASCINAHGRASHVKPYLNCLKP
ncbi:putative endo-polygalacturonase [Helianthus anomalus]